MSSHAPAAAPNTLELLSLLRSHQPRWADRFHLQRIGLFGSVARADATNESDLDV